MADSTDPSSNSLFGARAAVPLIGAFLVGLTAVTAYSLFQSPRREQVEKFSQKTAVGDSNYFQLPAPTPANPEPVLTWEGRAMVPLNYKPAKLEDTSMHPVYQDGATGLALYQQAKKDTIYIKVEANRYLEVKAR